MKSSKNKTQIAAPKQQRQSPHKMRAQPATVIGLFGRSQALITATK